MFIFRVKNPLIFLCNLLALTMDILKDEWCFHWLSHPSPHPIPPCIVFTSIPENFLFISLHIFPKGQSHSHNHTKPSPLGFCRVVWVVLLGQNLNESSVLRLLTILLLTRAKIILGKVILLLLKKKTYYLYLADTIKYPVLRCTWLLHKVCICFILTIIYAVCLVFFLNLLVVLFLSLLFVTWVT